jgi:hypothetical protein
MTNVVLHARLESRYAAVAGARGQERAARRGHSRAELVKANVRKMRKLVERLRWGAGRHGVDGYGEDDGYAAADRAAKAAFVREAARAGRGAGVGHRRERRATTRASPPSRAARPCSR